MGKSAKGNLTVLVIIISTCVIPFFAAWLFHKNFHWIEATTNYGNLIVPVVKIERTTFTGLDDFSRSNIDEFKGKWVMMHLTDSYQCAACCADSLRKSKQIRLMLNKDLLRVRRMLVVGDRITEAQASNWWENDETLLRTRPQSEFFEQISTIINRPLEQCMVFLMDPVGNLMMWYEPGFDPYGVQKDLKKLLKASQIG